jgi:hypothetical protein
VPEHDGISESDARLIAAAQTAASWAHARRATWTDAPLARTASPPPEEPPQLTAAPAVAVFVAHETETEPAPDTALTGTAPRDVIADAPSAVPLDIPPAPASPAESIGRAWIPVALPWLLRGGVAAALMIVVVLGGRYAWNMLPAFRKAPIVSAPIEPKAAARPTGQLRVTSTPDGAEVTVDHKPMGKTPLDLAELRPGRHDVVLTSDAGTIRRSVTIVANQLAVVDEAIFSGWVAIDSAIELTVVEGDRVLRPDERHQIMLPAGPHELRLTNRTLGYQETRQVEVVPGTVMRVEVLPAASTLTVTAADAAEVWVDGVRVGETPLNAAPVPLGTHEILVKRAGGGERRVTVTIGVKPFVLNVDF